MLWGMLWQMGHQVPCRWIQQALWQIDLVYMDLLMATPNSSLDFVQATITDQAQFLAYFRRQSWKSGFHQGSVGIMVLRIYLLLHTWSNSVVKVKGLTSAEGVKHRYIGKPEV